MPLYIGLSVGVVWLNLLKIPTQNKKKGEKKMGKGNKGMLPVVVILLLMFGIAMLIFTYDFAKNYRVVKIEAISSKTSDSSKIKESKTSSATVEPYDYGNGVYYFDYNYNNNFGPDLSSFIKKNQDLEIVAMTASKRDYGFFVVTRSKHGN